MNLAVSSAMTQLRNWLNPAPRQAKIVLSPSAPNRTSGGIHIFIDFGQFRRGPESPSLHINGLFELNRCRRAIRIINERNIPVTAWWIRGLSIHPAPLHRKVEWLNSVAKISSDHYICIVTENMSDRQRQQLFARLKRLESPIEYQERGSHGDRNFQK